MLTISWHCRYKNHVFVRPVKGSLSYLGPDTVQQYKVVRVEFCSDTIDTTPFVTIKIAFTRDI